MSHQDSIQPASPTDRRMDGHDELSEPGGRQPAHTPTNDGIEMDCMR